MTDDPSARASPALVSDDVVDLAGYTLGLTLTPAREWVEDRLRRANGQVNNPDAYIRQALKNRRRDDKRTTENRHADEPAKAARCPVHWLEEPCRGCAADRKVGAEVDP